ncbi:MAG: M15 family metallopeptidase [Clostridia bacterium]|nr:M15 family metallopeptidase [Clostridia bacterium]
MNDRRDENNDRRYNYEEAMRGTQSMRTTQTGTSQTYRPRTTTTTTTQMRNTNMNTSQMQRTGTTSRKRGGRRFKPTREGMIALAELFIIILIVFLVIFLVVKGISNRKKASDESTSTSTTEATTTQAPEIKWNAGYISLAIDSNSLHEGNLILVNKDYEYTFPSKMQSRLTALYGKTGGNFVLGGYVDTQYKGIQLNRSIIPTLSALCEEMIAKNQETLGSYTDKFGKTVTDRILVSSGYRSKEYQQNLYDEAAEKPSPTGEVFVAAPGKSEHHTGLVVDMQIYTADTKTIDFRASEYAWICDNAWKFGFVQRYSDSKFDITGISGEEWHYRFVDIPHAKYMTENDLCLEEYLDLLKTNHSSAESTPLEISTEIGDFLVYYVPADRADITYITVPKDNKKLADSFAAESSVASGMYTISGNNYDGFILTVAK